MLHEIKLDISFCDLVNNGVKTFEVRKNDRNYQIGDLVRFIPVGVLFHPIDHPIKDKIYEITYILSGWGIEEGFCVFAIKESEAESLDYQRAVEDTEYCERHEPTYNSDDGSM